MNTVLLGRTGIPVSSLCFGSLTIGPLQANLSPQEGGKVIAAALTGGVSFIDTAQLYGTYPHIREGLRQSGRDAVIATKAYAYDEQTARTAVEEARRALDRDVIDIFLLHEQESEHTLRGHREALDTLYRYKAQGVIRAVGLSTHHVAGVRAATQAGLDVVHPLLNYTGLGIADGTRADMEDAVKEAHEAGLGVYTMKALAGGHHFREASRALAYVRALPFVDAVAVGMQSVSEVEANLHFWQNDRFTTRQEAKLASQDRRILIEDWCPGCGQCAARCKSGAIAMEDGRARVNSGRCVLCGYCGAVCENFCIRIV